MTRSEKANAFSAVMSEPFTHVVRKIPGLYAQCEVIPKIYDDKQLQAIANSLALVGIDFNAVVFDGRSLLAVLQSKAGFFTGATRFKSK